MTAEESRLEAARLRKVHWKRWGPYLSERQWGTVREDYSADGDAWNHFPQTQARSRAYRWGEDGIAGLCDRHQYICFALALWNGRDRILKERLFGLANAQGNHGEDIKEYHYYLASTPTHSYMQCLYKYPQGEFPYQKLLEENARRSRFDPEYELLDTGIFDQDRYFDVFVEYAKASAEDILIRITAHNRGPEAAELHLLPTLWFRNTWSWGWDDYRPEAVAKEASIQEQAAVAVSHRAYGERWLLLEGRPELLFTENETNFERVFGVPNRTRYVKDAFHDYLIEGKRDGVNPAKRGTRMAGHYPAQIGPGESLTVRLRFTDQAPSGDAFGEPFEEVFATREAEADEFYSQRLPQHCGEDGRNVQRQAFAGLLWNKQFYNYDVRTWLDGDPAGPTPPPERRNGRNSHWLHLYNSDVISMPDKWEYPWYASWDLAFHCVALGLVDPDYAKEQLLLFLREWYMHPNGQVPAYEWNFADVNPPVHAWAAWRVYKIERRVRGRADRIFLERVFQKLLLNFTWWINREDPNDMNIFEGGFLGLDNIGLFDRSKPLPGGGTLELSDGTSWMAMYCLNMLAIALELAREDPAYEDVASKFLEHFIYIAEAMNNIGGHGIGLWDEQDGFYYNVMCLPDGSDHKILRVRSMVGLIPLFAVTTLEPADLERMPDFHGRMKWFLEHRPEAQNLVTFSRPSEHGTRQLLAIVAQKRLERVLGYMLDEQEFLSPYGIRSLSKYHKDHPYHLVVDQTDYGVDYAAGESTTNLFGGNSNWRGPIWMPLNFLLIEALQRNHYFYGDEFRVECPSGSGRKLTLWEVARLISRRLISIFLRGQDGRRPLYGSREKFQREPHWRDLILFHEYFHGDTAEGLGASHQTGWTALVAKLIEQSGEGFC